MACKHKKHVKLTTWWRLNTVKVVKWYKVGTWSQQNMKKPDKVMACKH